MWRRSTSSPTLQHNDDDRKLLLTSIRSTFHLLDDRKVDRGEKLPARFTLQRQQAAAELKKTRKKTRKQKQDLPEQNLGSKASGWSTTLSGGESTHLSEGRGNDNTNGRHGAGCEKKKTQRGGDDDANGWRKRKNGINNKRKRRDKKGCIPNHHTPVGKIILITVYSLLLGYTLLTLIGPLTLMFFDPADWCPYHHHQQQQQEEYNLFLKNGDLSTNSATINTNYNDDTDNHDEEEKYPNPDYITDPCRYARIPQLLFLTLEECDLSRRMLMSVLFGGAIGYERRSSDRPAGIRTMGLVSLGSCFFTISSQLAFKSSTMGWDSSRVTAAIPSGVGFLGAGLIWKGAVSVGEEEVHQVHGLTTAASVWLSAAIGVGAGGALYFVTAYSTILVVMVLRFGPKLYLQDDASYNEEEEQDNASSSYAEEEEEFSDNAITDEELDVKNWESDNLDRSPDRNDPTRYGPSDFTPLLANVDFIDAENDHNKNVGENVTLLQSEKESTRFKPSYDHSDVQRDEGEKGVASAISNLYKPVPSHTHRLEGEEGEQLHLETNDYFYGSIRSMENLNDTGEDVRMSLRLVKAENQMPLARGERLSPHVAFEAVADTADGSPERRSSSGIAMPKPAARRSSIEKKHMKQKSSAGRPTFHS